MEEWRNLMNNWSDLSGIVGCIDDTSHEIHVYMPGDGTERLYYSGHMKYQIQNLWSILKPQLDQPGSSSGPPEPRIRRGPG